MGYVGSNPTRRTNFMDSKKDNCIVIVQTVISGLTLVVAFFALLGALYVGIVQNSISQNLLDRDYEPNLRVDWESPTPPKTGFKFTNLGKAKVDFYQFTITKEDVGSALQKTSISRDGHSSILPGSTIFGDIKGGQTLEQMINQSGGIDKFDQFRGLTFFKTSNGKKYVLKTEFRIDNRGGELSLTWGSEVYIPYEWTEK